ncbi:MAG: Maf family protein [Acidobacteria bacterium]|nr:Maf family protein [Acidobacteriota bacterium]MCA1611931.1 Maf family protein [Acidobacteriota bacterium]
MTAALVLASTSPRRAQILAEMRIAFVVDPSSVDETLLSGELADAAAERLARAKAAEVARRRPEAWVLAADTLVVLDREILGKPQNDAEAARMLRRLSDRDHRVVTGVCFRKGGEELSEIAWSSVTFAPLSDEEIAWYVATGEPRDKAGAYGVQGLGARFVVAIDGSYTNVMGLPAAVVYRLMKEGRDSALAALALSSP